MFTEFIKYNETRAEFLSWKRKNVTIRGIKEAGLENDAGAMLGRGLYTAALSNKDLAKQYGRVNFVVNAIPKKPKVFNNLNDWEIWEYNVLINNYCKEYDVRQNKKEAVKENALLLKAKELLVQEKVLIDYPFLRFWQLLLQLIV